ncbi:GxxExxY protein [Sorangium sp. So ce887]|uniref:GxxExxY protein n=1 Tax=Sorangium sp. So ce887 TaxID=3133324 RepID=UPI003F5F22E0
MNENDLASDSRLDRLAGERVIVERKATVAHNRVFEAQALTYLRLSNLKLAIVINFGEVSVRQGIHRVVRGAWSTNCRNDFPPLPCLFAPLRLCAFALNSGFPL